VDFKKKRHRDKLEAEMDFPDCLTAAADLEFIVLS
jgi:hypothetical protein